jgi:arylsulfatase
MVARGARSDATGTVMDLLPTFLDIAGTRHPGASYRGKPVLTPRGVSLLPVLYGKAPSVHGPEEAFGWELFGQRSVRQGDWKLVWDHAAPEDRRRWALYDLRTDPAEQHDLAARNPEQLQRMLQHWERYDQQTGVIY